MEPSGHATPHDSLGSTPFAPGHPQISVDVTVRGVMSDEFFTAEIIALAL
jgi:hypothetical protein